MDFIDDFIHEYKNNPCLWKASSIHFKNRVKRQEAYMKLITVAAKHGEHYNVERTKQKINNLRCAFRHQFKKYIEINKGEKDEPYCPKRRYFESLMFLKDEENTDTKNKTSQLVQNPENGKNSSESEVTSDCNDSTANTKPIRQRKDELPKVKEKNKTPPEVGEQIQCAKVIERKYAANKQKAIPDAIDNVEVNANREQTEPPPTYDCVKDVSTYSNTEQSDIISRKRSSSLCSQQLDFVDNTSTPAKSSRTELATLDLERLVSLACRNVQNNTDDHFTNFGKVIAHKLRTMDNTQAVISEKIISDVLFQGQMKLLSIMSMNQFLNVDYSNACEDAYNK